MPTGFGGGGLATVTANSTLSGGGTPASPLGVTGWPLTYFQNSDASASTTLTAANQVYITGFVLPYALTFSNLGVFIQTADAVNLYSFGIYSQAGTLVAHSAAATIPATGDHTFAVVGGPVTIAPGLYLMAFTGNANTAAIGQNSGSLNCWVRNTSVVSSAGGVMPASIPAQTVAIAQFPFFQYNF